MKILHIIYSLNVGGAERLLSELAPRLKSMGHEVDILVFDDNKTLVYESCINKGVKVFSLNTHSAYNVINAFKMIPIIRQYDIVHAHTTPAQIMSAIAHLFVSKRVKLVTTEHSTNNHRRGKFLFRLIDKWMYSHFSKIICIAAPSKSNLEKQIGKTNKVVVIENGIDVSAFENATRCERKAIGCDADDFVLTMVGRFVDAKDQDTIIKALAQLPEKVKLVLVGEGSRIGECKALSRKLKVENRTHFLGIRNDVPDILKASDIALMSSHWEGLSLSSVEGMAVGIPFIASDVQGLKEVVGGAGIMFSENNSAELAEKIAELMNNPELYKKVSTACLERARKYDISRTAYSYNLCYQQLA